MDYEDNDDEIYIMLSRLGRACDKAQTAGRVRDAIEAIEYVEQLPDAVVAALDPNDVEALMWHVAEIYRRRRAASN